MTPTRPSAPTKANGLLIKNGTVNGIGLSLCAYRPVAPGVFRAIRCFTFLYVPLIPISIWVVRPLCATHGAGALLGNTFHYTILERRRLELDAVLRMYANCLLWGALALGPLAYMEFFAPAWASKGDGAFLTALFWACGLLAWRKYRNDSIYRRPKA